MSDQDASDAALSLEQELHNEKVADEFEKALKAHKAGGGPDPQVADYLGDLSAAGLALVARLVELKAEYASRNAQTAVSRQGTAGSRLPLDSRLEGTLGGGGMGMVYIAVHEPTKRRVALKMIRPGYVSSEMRARFQVEIEAGCSLNHPNIVQVLEVSKPNSEPYFSMTLVENGKSLEAYAANRGISPRDAAHLVEEVARAVHHAHQRGVIHRDIKPANIVVDSQGKPFLTDFGLARFLAAPTTLTKADTILGTPHYMSPEQTEGNQTQLTAWDIYGLGAVLYELLTGQPPIKKGDDEGMAAFFERVRNEEPLKPRSLKPTIERDLETVCLKCLEKEPGKRYASAQALADDLRRFLGGDCIVARRVRWTERLWRSCQKYKARTTAVAAIFAALLLAAWLFLLQSTVTDLLTANTTSNFKAYKAKQYARGVLVDEYNENLFQESITGLTSEESFKYCLCFDARALEIALELQDSEREQVARERIGSRMMLWASHVETRGSLGGNHSSPKKFADELYKLCSGDHYSYSGTVAEVYRLVTSSSRKPTFFPRP